MSSFGLPAGAFDADADDAIWGSSAPNPPSAEQRRVANTYRARDVDSRKELFLLGSTFKSDKVTVDYVAVNLTHTANMNPREANRLAKKLKRNQGSIAISLGVMSHDKCEEMEEALKLRDIDCRALPVAGSSADDNAVKNVLRNASKRPPINSMAQSSSYASDPNNRDWFAGSSSVAGSVRSQSVACSVPPPPPPPADDCSEARSHNTQTSTPRVANVRKAFGFGSSAASMSSRAASSRKPNHVASGAMSRQQQQSANSIDFGDVTARSRTKGAGPSIASAPKPTSSAASAAAQKQSLIFSSGNYDGEKHFGTGKPHGKGTFTMPGQFSYTGLWARGNPVGSGHFTLASGEIREGSWTGTNFIESRRYLSKKQKTPKNNLSKGNQSIATEASKRNGTGEVDVVVDQNTSSSKLTASSLEEPSLLPERNTESFDETLVKKESAMSGASSGGYPAECGPYMIGLRAITKPSARKSGSLAIHDEKTVAIMSYDDVGTYEGEWKGGNTDGLPHGMGCFDFTDGTRYFGEFSGGMPSGDGRFTFKDGSTHSRRNHNGDLSPNQVTPGTPATEASSEPSEPNRAVDCSPLSTVTMSPVLSKAKLGEEHLQNAAEHKSSADIDIPALNEDTNEAFQEGPTSEKTDKKVTVEATENHELTSRILPYKRGPSIPNTTSFTPTETESVESENDAKEDEVVGLPAGAFDDVADDAIWGSSSPTSTVNPTSAEQHRVANTAHAFRDVDVDMAPDLTDNVVVEDSKTSANSRKELFLSRILPYKRGLSIPNTTETESVENESEAKKNEVTNSVQAQVRGGLNALLKDKMKEDPESVRHLIETPFVLKLDETREQVIKYLDTAPGKTTSASYAYSEIGTYNGEFRGGYPHGIGTFFWIDGTTYSGSFAEGEPEGDGKLVLPSGEMFVRCAYDNDIIHLPAQKETDDAPVSKSVDSNVSTASNASGEAGEYKGEIVAGVPHGLGSMKFADGTQYIGQWRNGSPAKEGTFYFPNGDRHYGRWNGSKFEPIKKQKGLPVETDLTGSPLPAVQEENGVYDLSDEALNFTYPIYAQSAPEIVDEDGTHLCCGLTSFWQNDSEENAGEQSCTTSVKSGTSSRSNHAHNEVEKKDADLDEDPPQNNCVGGITHLDDTDSIGDTSGFESMIASMDMSVFSDIIEDASVFSQLSGISTPKKAAKEKKHGDEDAGSLFDEKSASQGSVSRGETSRNSHLPIDVDDASFYSTDDDEVEEEKSRVSSQSSSSANPKQLRPSKTACRYYNGFTAKCRPYLSSLRSIRHFSIKKSGSLQRKNGRNIAGVTYSGIGEYDGAWRGSMLKGVPHGHGQFSWSDGTRYVGDWDRGIPIGQDGHFVFLDGTVCNRSKGIVVVQALVRGFLARQPVAKQQAKAATTIQTAWRVYDASHQEKRIAAATLIQNFYRPHAVAKVSATTRIQTAVRSSTARAAFLEKRSSTILIQSQARKHAARASFLALARACVILQARFRGNLLRKEMEARYIDVDALDDDTDSVQIEDADPSHKASTEEETEKQPSQIALAAQVYPPDCAAYFESLDLSSVSRKGSLYWNENGKHASLTYTSEKVQYNGEWKGSLLDGKPHGDGKMKFSDRTKFYGSFVDGIPTSTGYFKLKKGGTIYSKHIETIRQDLINELLGIGDRLETEFIVSEMYHEMSDVAIRLEADDDAIARMHLDLAYLLEEDFIITEQNKISAIEESLKQIEAELAVKRAAEVAALTALRRSIELQEAITRKRAATKIQALVRRVQTTSHYRRALAAAGSIQSMARGMITRKRAATKIQALVRRMQMRSHYRRAVAAAGSIQSLARGVAARANAFRRAMALDMLRTAMRSEEQDALPQDSIIAVIKQVDGLEEETDRIFSSSFALSSEAMAARFLSDSNIKANPNTREKIAYLHDKGLPIQKIDEIIKKVNDETKEAEANTRISAKMECDRAPSSDDSSDHHSRNTASTSASSSATANAPITTNKKRSFRPTSVAKKVRSALARGKGNVNWAASAPRAEFPRASSPNNEDDGESALASFAALQDALDSIALERKD